MGNLYNIVDSSSLNNFEKTYNKFIKNKSQFSTYNLIKNNRFQSKYKNIIPYWQVLQDLSYELVDGLKITGKVNAGEFLKQETQRKIFSDKYYTFYIRVKNPNSNFYIEIEYPENDVVNVDDLTATTKTVINLDDVDGIKEYRAYFKTSDNGNIDKISITFCSKNNVTLLKEFIIQEVSFYEGYLDATGITNEELFDLSVEYDDFQKYWKLTNDGKNYYRILLDDVYFNNRVQNQINVSISGITGSEILGKLKQVDGSGSGLDADLLDGHDSSYFANNLLSNVSNSIILNKLKQVDGSNSGLDADKLDGKDSSYFANTSLSNVSDSIILNKLKNVDGSGSGLNADLLDGLNSSQFLRRDTSSYPSQDNQFDLGNATHKWKNIYATTFQGTATNADKLDGHDSSYFAKNDLSNVSNNIILNKLKQVDGSGSGLDADKLDGLNSSQFLRSDVDDVANGNIEFKKNVTVDGNISIIGNLEVSGTTTTVNTQELTVKDNIITLNSNLTSGTPPKTLKSGIEVLRGDNPKATFYWYEDIKRWQFEQPINLNQIWFNYPGNNTDNLGIYRHNTGLDKTDLRIQIGDNTSGDDKLVIGTAVAFGTWKDLFKFYNNGNAEFSGKLKVNSISVNNSSIVTNLNADKLDGHDSSYFANATLSNVSDSIILNKLKNVDGSNSGLDADKLDGKDSSYFANTSLSNVSNITILNKLKQVDGSGSGLNADLLDGYDSSYFANNSLSNVSNNIILNKLKQVDGSGSGLDADLLDGLNSSQFLRRDTSSYPSQDNRFDLGSITHKWKNVYAAVFHGIATNADKLDGHDSSYFAKSDLSNVSDSIILNKLKNVDGNGSGLDADKLDGRDSNYFFQLDNYAMPSLWNPKTNWQKVGGFTIQHDYGRDTYIAINNNKRRVHLVIDGDVYVDNGFRKLAYDDLSNVSNSTILNKLKDVDGSGSGLDADKLDGKDSSYFANTSLSNVSNSTILNKLKQVDGSGSGLDADLLDGLNSSQFLRSDIQKLELPIVNNMGNKGKFVVKKLGKIQDTKSGLILFARKYDNTHLSKQGFEGFVFINRGGATSYNISKMYRIVCVTAYQQSEFYLDGNSGSEYLVEVEYNGETWYGLYSSNSASRIVTIIGQLWGDPIFIDDADSYSITKINGINLYINQYKVWYAGNDGSGSGLDADKLDGKDSNYFFQLNNYAMPSLWNPKTNWQKVGGFTINHNYGKDTYIALDNGDGRKVHLVIDGDIYANEGSKRLAYDDLSNVSNNTILNKLKQVDGSGSGLDADLLDGHDISFFAKNNLSNVSDTVILNKLKQVDGSGSGLDADLLDGKDSSYFANISLSNVSNSTILNKLKNVDGSGSGLDADKLDGLHSSSFLRRDTSSYPSQDNQFDLGNATHKWKNIYATTFQGTTLEAENADLAEKYTCKDEVEVGDIVQVSSNSNYEIEKCNETASLKVIGVVSEKPALLMNKKENGVAIALKGKVKCKVLGPIRKGEPIVSYENGIGISYYNLNQDILSQHIKFVGVALEDIEQDEVRKILVIL